MTHSMCTPFQARSTSSLFPAMRWGIFPICAFVLFMQGCGSTVPSANGNSSAADHYGVTATWDDARQTLTVTGKTSHDDDGVDIHDADTNTLLGQAAVKDDGTWTATATTNACAVHVALPSGTVTANVIGAPADCAQDDASSGISARGAVDIESLGAANPELLATIPNGLIVSPRADTTVDAGQTILFAASVSGTGITQPVSFFWNFGGAASNSSVQNPGPVRFNVPGVYRVQLFTVDGLGVQDPTPATRLVTVVGNTPNATAPVPTILSPQTVNGGVISVSVGQSLFFRGAATDGTGNTGFSYEWDFAGVIPTQFGATPGDVIFSRAGRFVVTLNVMSALGVRSVTPATLTVVVGLTANANQAPDSSITSPRSDISINPGDVVNFEGRGRDADNNVPFTYSWDFNGVAQNIYNSPVSNGGNISFTVPGVYVVTFMVTDALGLSDPNPSTRVITVNNTGTGGVVNPLADSIISPPTDVSIVPGASVFFTALAAGTNTGTNQYFWNFGGAAPASNQQTPGSITFPSPGVFLVELFVVDRFGNVIGAPSQRVINVGGVTPQVDATIVSPADDTTVNVGTPINLIAQISNQGFGNLTYLWEVIGRSTTAGPVFTSNRLTPGSFTPTIAGRYRIKFTASGFDNLGNPINTSVSRKVTVNDPNATVGTPNGSSILSPAQDMVISVGGSVAFQAGVVAGNNLDYYWDFGGAAAPSTQRNPGTLFFAQPGTFIVTLQITGIDASGLPMNITTSRVITVLSQFPGNLPPVGGGTQTPVSLVAPEGTIVTPATNRTIRVGTPVNFVGRGFDPLGLGGLQFVWGFSGATPGIVSQNPGNVTFNRVGVYAVTLTVVNAFGEFDPTPATVVINVTP